MEPATPIPQSLSSKALFIVWGPPSHGPRSRVFAAKLGIPIDFVFSTRKRGLLVAPWKYSYQIVRTIRILASKRPSLVFVQSPPSFAVFAVWIYCAVTRARFVVDAHSAAFLSPYWERPRWLRRFLARQAVTTIVTNEHFAGELRAWEANATVMRDIPTDFSIGEALPRGDGFTIMVVSTFADDEPLGPILDAASRLSDVDFLVTGDTARLAREVSDRAPANVRFTGFMPDDVYYATMAACDAVLCLTTRDNTMQRGACEALSMGRPIITSDWPLLRDYFSRGTVHVSADAGAIAAAVETMSVELDRFTREIEELQLRQEAMWRAASGDLARLLDQ